MDVRLLAVMIRRGRAASVLECDDDTAVLVWATGGGGVPLSLWRARELTHTDTRPAGWGEGEQERDVFSVEPRFICGV